MTGLLRWPVRLASLAVALAVWQLLTAADVRFWIRFDRFPGPVEVLREFGRQIEHGQFWQDIAQSLARILTGFVLAAVLGVVLGVATARSRWAADLLQPLLDVARPIPAIALVPVAILLFPANEQGIVFITFVAAFFP